MFDKLTQLNQVIAQHPSPEISIKSDTSPLTELDLAINSYLESTLGEIPGVSFYTEEQSQDFSFPLFAIDPIDGTKEFIKNRPEWVVSIAYLANNRWQGEGWVYNPRLNKIYDLSSLGKRFPSQEKLKGEVSHTEWEAGLYQGLDLSQVQLNPMGSIAYKLARLSHGEIDFVVSLKPKNLWDIAAGTLLCKSQEFKFYSQGKEVTEVLKAYEPPLIWCREQDFSLLSNLFS